MMNFAFIGTGRCDNSDLIGIQIAELTIFVIVALLITIVVRSTLRPGNNKKKLWLVPLIYLLGSFGLVVTHTLALCHDESGGTFITILLGLPLYFLESVF